MQLTADQELRRELLQFALSKQPEIEAAIAMAARMERFVLEGYPATVAGHPECIQAESGGGASLNNASAPANAGPHDRDLVRKRRWSAEDDAQLTQMWHADALLEDIAQQLDRTVPSLYSRARALGFARRDPKLSARAGEADRGAAVGTPGEPAQEKIERLEAPVVGNGRGVPPSNARRSDLNVDRYRTPRFDPPRPGRVWRGPASVGPGQPHGAAWQPATGQESQTGVDPIIQFLRSRDYSVVRVEEGRFKLDGRSVLNVDQLRDKANQMRKSMGLPPFVREFAEPAE